MTESFPIKGSYRPCPACGHPAVVTWIVGGSAETNAPGGVTIGNDANGRTWISPHTATCVDRHDSDVPEAQREIERYAGRFEAQTYDYERERHSDAEPNDRALASIFGVLHMARGERAPAVELYPAIRERVLQRRADRAAAAAATDTAAVDAWLEEPPYEGDAQ